MSATSLGTMIFTALHHGAHELLMKGYHWIGEKVEESKAEHLQAAKTTMSAFLEAVGGQKYDHANSLCTPELLAGFKPNAITVFGKIREHLLSTTAINLTEGSQLKLLGTSCHLSGIINYTGNRSAHFFLDVVPRQGHWKVNGYHFDAVPLSAESLKERLAGKPSDNGGSCPADCSIKVSSRNIYHLPGGQYYSTTHAVRCFATEAAAKTAGFRPSRR
jgi:hypothetical protein